MSKETGIPKELAEEQLELFFNYYEMDLEEALADEDEGFGEDDESAKAVRRAANQLKKKLVKAIQYGRLEIKDAADGGLDVIQYLKFPLSGGFEALKWNGITGLAKAQLKDLDKGSPFNKLYSFAGAITKAGDKIRNLRDMDLATAEALVAVFLRV